LEPYVDDECGPQQVRALERHLRQCPVCREQHALAAAVCRDLQRLPELDASPQALATIRQRVARNAPARRRAAGWLRLAAAAAVAAAAGATLWHGRPRPADEASIERARREARLALAVVATVTREAGDEVRCEVLQEHVVRPTVSSITSSLEEATQAADLDFRIAEPS
jgi:anti-sigma factor RsiW